MSRVLNAGHNGGVTENTFFHHLKVMDDLDRQKASLMSKIKNAKKQAKDDGINMKVFDAVRTMRAVSQEELARELDITFAFMKYLKMPVAQQLAPIDISLVDESIADLSDEERAAKWENDGFIAGRSGTNKSDCPHQDPNSPAAKSWVEGWERGQAENAKGIKEGPKKTSSDADSGKLDGGVKPKHEPEVEEAGKKKASGGRTKGTTYWHDAEKRKVYEVTSADPDPEGATSITKKEFEKLKAEYAKADEDDWDNAAKAAAEAGSDKADDDFGDDDPPAPDAA